MTNFFVLECYIQITFIYGNFRPSKCSPEFAVFGWFILTNLIVKISLDKRTSRHGGTGETGEITGADSEQGSSPSALSTQGTGSLVRSHLYLPQ